MLEGARRLSFLAAGPNMVVLAWYLGVCACSTVIFDNTLSYICMLIAYNALF